MSDSNDILGEMNDRSREVFRRVVEGYLATGDPVGSRTLTRDFSEKVSAATIRNVMQDLEYLGLLDSPHVSAGRIPSQQGLRMFVDGLLEVRDLDRTDQQAIDDTLGQNAGDVGSMLDRVGAALSGVTQGASWCSLQNTKRRSAISNLSALLMIALWWFWSWRMAMLKTVCSRHLRVKRQARCEKPRIS